jgi:hypothetical protein
MEYVLLSYTVVGVVVFVISIMECSTKMGLSYAFFWPIWAVAEFIRFFIWTVKEIIGRYK